MTIMQNAIHSIQVGVEDFQIDSPGRQVSAVRNLSAGILLLYKEKLCRLSPKSDPELFIKKDIRPVLDDKEGIVFRSYTKQRKRFKTVDVHDITLLFSSLKITTDWQRFKKMNGLRNDVEHLYTAESPSTVREIISDCFLLIRDFLIDELGEEPIEVIGSECWNTLLNVNEVYEKELNQCKETFSNFSWPYPTISRAVEYIRCPKCSSEFTKVRGETTDYPNIFLYCTSCSHEFDFQDVLIDCVHEELYADAYIAMTDGGELPWDDCEQCGLPVFVLDEQACMNCSYEMNYGKCSECGESKNDNYELCDRCDYLANMDIKG